MFKEHQELSPEGGIKWSGHGGDQSPSSAEVNDAAILLIPLYTLMTTSHFTVIIRVKWL